METLYSWKARRSGGRITIKHSCGNITAIDVIKPEDGKLVATHSDGRKFALYVPAA